MDKYGSSLGVCSLFDARFSTHGCLIKKIENGIVNNRINFTCFGRRFCHYKKPNGTANKYVSILHCILIHGNRTLWNLLLLIPLKLRKKN